MNICKMLEATPRDNLDEFFSSGKKLKFSRNDVIISSDDDPELAYYVESGYVKVCSYSDSGSELIHFIYGPGELFPISWLFSKPFDDIFFVAIRDIRLSTRSKRDFLLYIENHPEILRRMVEALLNALHRIYSFNVAPAKTRVILTLLELGRRFGVKQKDTQFSIDLPLTNQEFSGLVRLSRETTSKILRELESRGTAIMGRRNILLDHNKLEAELRN